MNKAGSSPPSPWVVYDYEVDMFTQALGACQTGAYRTFQHPVPNAIVESMLLDLRILVDIFLSRGADPDDIKLTDLLPGLKSPLINELRHRYGNRNTAQSPCWILNKMLAHPTTLRSNSYSYAPVLTALLPLMLPLLEEIREARGK